MNQITYKRTKNGVSVTSVETDYLDTMAIWKAIDSPFFLWTSESEKIHIVFCETKSGIEDGLGWTWVYLPYKCSKKIKFTGWIVEDFNDKITAVFDEFNRNNDANYIKRVKTDPREKYFSSAKMAMMAELDKQFSCEKKCKMLADACLALLNSISNSKPDDVPYALMDAITDTYFAMNIVVLRHAEIAKEFQEKFIEKMMNKLSVALDNKTAD